MLYAWEAYPLEGGMPGVEPLPRESGCQMGCPQGPPLSKGQLVQGSYEAKVQCHNWEVHLEGAETDSCCMTGCRIEGGLAAPVEGMAAGHRVADRTAADRMVAVHIVPEIADSLDLGYSSLAVSCRQTEAHLLLQ